MTRPPYTRRNPLLDPDSIKKSLRETKLYKRVEFPGGDFMWTDSPEGDDTFPPAVAGYEARNGWLVATGRNGSVSVIVGTVDAIQTWMLAVDATLAKYPLATDEPWSEAKHGGAEYIGLAKEAARAVLQKFGLTLGRVDVRVSTDEMAPSHPKGANGFLLVNLHTPAPARFLGNKTGLGEDAEITLLRAPKVGAHEASHIGFGVRSERAHYVLDVLKARQAAKKPFLSDYHAWSGHAEGVAEAGAFYTLAPQTLQYVAPEVYAAVAWWFGEGPKP